jgi:TetR/AcrR family transcriptional repressor of nem operon
VASPRRVGAETSKTRDVLLDSVERLMLERGYAGVSYRRVAAKAGVTPALVQYYFPTLDHVFIAAIRRRADRNLEHLRETLSTHADKPLRVVWEFSRDEATAALMIEFTALCNHRESIRTEIAEVTEQVRQVELEALTAKLGTHGRENGDLSPEALLFLATGIPKMIKLERGLGVSTAHAEVIDAVEQYLDRLEPNAGTPRRKASTRRTPARRG